MAARGMGDIKEREADVKCFKKEKQVRELTTGK